MKAAGTEPRAQPELVYGWSWGHARLNETQQREPEDLNPFGARLSVCGQGEQEGWVPMLLCQGQLWMRQGPLPG